MCSYIIVKLFWRNKNIYNINYRYLLYISKTNTILLINSITIIHIVIIILHHRRPPRLLQIVNAEVELWTSHRVMEWLNSIDLSEYSSTLRGSGIHGALMVIIPTALSFSIFNIIVTITIIIIFSMRTTYVHCYSLYFSIY